jgi:hypothetical protein
MFCSVQPAVCSAAACNPQHSRHWVLLLCLLALRGKKSAYQA